MIYSNYTIGGELMHYAKGSEKSGAKYIDKVKTKTGKWRYIYKKASEKVTGKKAKAKLELADERYKTASKNREKAADDTKRAYNQLNEYRNSENGMLDYNDCNYGNNVRKAQVNAHSADIKEKVARDIERTAGHAASKAADEYYNGTVAGKMEKLLDKIQKKKKK